MLGAFATVARSKMASRACCCSGDRNVVIFCAATSAQEGVRETPDGAGEEDLAEVRVGEEARELINEEIREPAERRELISSRRSEIVAFFS